MYKSDRFSTRDDCCAKTVNSIRARPLQHSLFKRLLGENGDLILRTEVRWLSRGKVLFRFQVLVPAIVEFLQDRTDLPPQFSVVARSCFPHRSYR
jgi:hypothetical protein